jgi:LDH2 family malate/lactate/ureidoglycolate dehydrogenase
MDQPRTRVPAAAITGLIEDALAKVGLLAADAAKVAELMTEADLTGADAHGCSGCRNMCGGCARVASMRSPTSR